MSGEAEKFQEEEWTLTEGLESDIASTVQHVLNDKAKKVMEQRKALELLMIQTRADEQAIQTALFSLAKLMCASRAVDAARVIQLKFKTPQVVLLRLKPVEAPEPAKLAEPNPKEINP